MSEIRRNLESNGPYLNHFWTGVVDNRSPLFTPMSSMGIQMIQRMDCLLGVQGSTVLSLNMELSPKATIWRRPGYSKFCSVAFSSSAYPLTFVSFKNLSNTIRPIVDTPTNVYTFTTSTLTSIFTKSTSQQSSFIPSLGNFTYWCDGTSAKKYDGTHVWNWGITAPSVTPGLSFSAGSLSPTSGFHYVYCYVNTVTGHVSTASPMSANTGPQTSKNIAVSYTASTDAQVNAIWIFRTDDGGSLFYFVASVSNTTSSYTDAIADSGLNDFIVAPIADANDPAPSGLAHVAFYAGRPWGSVGNVLHFAAGPDTTTGLGQESWPPANNFTLPSPITCLKVMSVGLAVFTTDDVYLLAGTDDTSFTLLPWQVNFGVLSENAVAQDGDVLYVFTSRGMFYSIQYGVALTEIGFNNRPNLAVMNPANVYVALHRDGADEGLFISDGSTNIWRYGLDFGAWSPVTQPVMGCHAISSIETSVGTWSLLMGIGSGSSFIFNRNLTSFTDNGTAYPCKVTIGNLVVSPPGQVSVIDKILVQIVNGSPGTWTYPTVGVLLNNISGSFTTIPNPVGDPPMLAGTSYESTNPLSKCHYWKSAQTPLPQQVQNMQIQITFASDTTQSELLGTAIG